MSKSRLDYLTFTPGVHLDPASEAFIVKHSFAPQFIYFYVVREIQLSIVPAFSLLVFSYLFSVKADDLQQDDAATVVAKWAG